MYNIFDIKIYFYKIKSMETLFSIGRKIKETRLEKNITMDFVAQQIGISRATLSNIEKGKGNYSVDTLINLLSFLNIPIKLGDKNSNYKRNRATRTNLKQDKKINRFVILCIEMYSKYKNRFSFDIYKILKSHNVLDMLSDDYEDLHGMSTEWLNEYIDSFVEK